ncbi:unnamed protein product [Prunus armeniaca]
MSCTRREEGKSQPNASNMNNVATRQYLPCCSVGDAASVAIGSGIVHKFSALSVSIGKGSQTLEQLHPFALSHGKGGARAATIHYFIAKKLAAVGLEEKIRSESPDDATWQQEKNQISAAELAFGPARGGGSHTPPGLGCSARTPIFFFPPSLGLGCSGGKALMIRVKGKL